MLQFVVELDPEEAVLKVLHELLVVNAAGTIDVSGECDGENLALRDAKCGERFETLHVFEWFEETFVVLVEVPQHPK